MVVELALAISIMMAFDRYLFYMPIAKDITNLYLNRGNF